MTHPIKALLRQDVRPFTILALVAIVLGVMDHGTGFLFSLATAFSVMQLFATFGLVALAVGLSLLIREFDISVAGMVSLAGTIAVMTGVANPWLGLTAASAFPPSVLRLLWFAAPPCCARVHLLCRQKPSSNRCFARN